jgi:hypothetical protein
MSKAMNRAAQIALACGLIVAAIAGFKGCQQTRRLNRPVATEGIPEGHDYLMRTETGSDFYTKLKSLEALPVASMRCAEISRTA